MKFATHFLAYNLTDIQINQILNNCAPHFERIYVAYSDKPWGYHPLARSTFTNSTNIDTIRNSPHFNKVQLIYGDWLRDEDQRNACADAARKDGMDTLFIQDADEYYHDEDIDKLKSFISRHPDTHYFKTPWCSYWKTWQYRIIDDTNSSVLGFPEVAMNLHTSRFINCRIPSGHITLTHGGVMCHHGSFVLSDKQCYEKIKTWGHSHEFDSDRWYQQKWLNWTESTQDLHPISPPAWKQAVTFNMQDLPKCIII